MIDVNKSYWFYMEPYVYRRIENMSVLLYNTLDSVSIQNNYPEVFNLLYELSAKDSSGVIELTEKQLKNKNIVDFVNEVREKYMGDIIDVLLSKGKPLQVVPILNLQENVQEEKKESSISSSLENLKYLNEITVYLNLDFIFEQIVDSQFLRGNNPSESWLSALELMDFLDSILKQGINILQFQGANIWKFPNFTELMNYLSVFPAKKKFVMLYDEINDAPLSLFRIENAIIKVYVRFPIKDKLFMQSIKKLKQLQIEFEVEFSISNEDEFKQAEKLAEQLNIEQYSFSPLYSRNNNEFFQNYLFINKDDILSSNLSMREIFAHQALNTYDFGKITILPNGDVYANLNMPKLGNIKNHSIHEIIYTEMNEGQSWLRIRDYEPCNKCLFQWLCPSPSNYELVLGKPNLCHIVP